MQAASTRLAFQPVVSNVRLGDVIRNDQTFNFSSTIGFVMRFELTRNSYTIVKCATFFCFCLTSALLEDLNPSLTRFSHVAFAHMISARVCVSHSPSQAPPVSFINVLVLLASLAGSVVAAFGVLLSVLETRLGITSGMHHT